MANAENINKVIASIRGEIEATKDVGFNMSDWVGPAEIEADDRTGRNCGTIACIAGHAYLVSGGEDRDATSDDVVPAAQEFLDLKSGSADELFYAYGSGESMYDITSEQAIRTLEHLRDTGEVNWKA